MPKRSELLRLFLAEQRDPEPFYRRLAADAVERLPFSVSGTRLLDLGCGPGHYTRALRDAGALVLPVDLDPREFLLPGGPPGGHVVGDGAALPVATASVDGVLCSNMLEHTPDPRAVIDELERVVRPGGWMWVSWTNWYSPWGGHDISPWHYLGPRIGLATYERLRHQQPKNEPGVSLFPVHIGRTLHELRRRPGVRIVDAIPRYYPSQRWILRIPALREVATWNCLVILERTAA